MSYLQNCKEHRVTPSRIAAAAAITVLAVSASGLPVIRTEFIKVNKIKPTSQIAQAQCNLCHVTNTTKMNPFGADLKAAMKSAKSRKLTPDIMKLVGAKDSDKDGVKNAAEIKADTLPGDPKSKPAKK